MLNVRCGYICSAGKKDHLLLQFITELKVFSFFLNRLVQHYEGKVWGVIVGLWWGDKEHTECRAGPGLWKTLHTDPPCEKFPVPRARCVRLGGNNSPAPLTSSFGLLRFMTLSSAIQLLHAPQLPFALIGSDGRLREEDEGEETGKQLGWGGKLVRYGMEHLSLFYHGHYRWLDGHNFPCGPHLTVE